MRSAKAARFPAPTWPETGSVDSSSDLERLFDRAAEILLIALIAFVPWPLGSVHAWAEEVVVAASGLLAVCLTIKLLTVRGSRIVGSWTYLPIAVFLLLVLVQLLPMPHAALRAISANTLQIKSRLLADLPDAVKGPMTLTFYANATRHDLGMVLACVMVFVVSLNVLRTRGRIKRMLIAISVVGGLTILLALAQDLTDARKLYWTITKPIPLAVGGPFVGHNDFPLFANLSIGAAAALFMVIGAERRSSRSHRSSAVSKKPITAAQGALIAVVVLGACAVFLSLSRSGVSALGAAAICIGAIAAYRFRLGLERSLLTACVLAIFTVTFCLASNSVNHRLETLQRPFEEYFSRWQIVKDILAGWREFPLFGTGLGTHEVVYPMFERLLNTGDFNHAENEYAQMLEETGAVGLGVILLFIGIVAGAFIRVVRTTARSPIGAAAFGLAFGLLAVTLQSVLGFGEHVAANAVLTAVEFALLLNIARLVANKTAPVPEAEVQDEARGKSAAAAWFGVKLAGGIALVVALVFVLPNADRARRGQAEWEPARVIFDNYGNSYASFSDEQYADAITAAGSAHLADPDNVTYSYWQATYQWAPIDSRHDPNLPDDVRPQEEKKLAAKLVGDFNHVRVICPTFGGAVFMAGQLKYAVLDDPAGYGLLRLAATLAPTNPTVFLELASVECRRGEYAEAMNACRHCLSLTGVVQARFDDVVDVLVREAKRPDLAIELAANDPDRELAIVTALRALPDRPDFQTLASSLEQRANSDRKTVLVKICQQPDVPAADVAALADIYRSEHDFDHAVEYYQRALASEYDQVDWRMNLAQTLLDAGHRDEAEQEASIVLRLDPNSDAARQFLLHVTRPGGTSIGQ